MGHEEDGLRVLAAMEAQGWMHHLFPAWAASADAPDSMHQLVTQLQMQGVSPDISAASMHFLTAKLSPRPVGAQAMFVALALSKNGTTSTTQPKNSINKAQR